MRAFLFLCCSTLVFAQAGGTDPKRSPEEYEVHANLNDAGLGAEYMVHSFSGQGQMYIAGDFLVVEVALYPPKGKSLPVDPGAFALRVAGKKQLLLPVTPGMVAATLQNPEWQDRPHMEAGGGLGNTGVIFGRPVPGTVPGGPQPAPPRVPRAPDPDPPGGIERQPRVSPQELLLATALPKGDFAHPVSGYLYFAYRGKASGIKSLELIYRDTALKLK